LLALAGLCVLIIWIVRRYPNNRPVCFLGLFFFLALLPTSNLIVLIGSIMAERFLYLPSLGFAGCTAAVVTWASLRVGTKKAGVLTMAAFALVTFALAVRCFDRVKDWGDYGRLYAHDVLTSPNSHKTHVARMDMIERTSVDFGAAIQEGEAAIAILKNVPPEQNNERIFASLGALYGVQGDVYAPVLPATARLYYDRALELYLKAEQIDQALDRQLRKLQIAAGKPPDRILRSGLPDVYLGLIAMGRRLNDYPRALGAAQYLSQVTPGDPKVYATLAAIQTQLGDTEGAILSHWKALALENPPAGEEANLLTAYRKLSPPDCSVTGDTVNSDCAPVRHARCAARHQIADALANAGLAEEALRERRKAAEAGCAEDVR